MPSATSRTSICTSSSLIFLKPAPITQRMLELAEISAGSKLLDIASGTGEPAISAAKIVGASGKVVGTDLVDEMLEVAREKSIQAELSNIEFLCVDGESLEYADDSFDAVTLRWGLMFMPEPLKCLAAAHKALKSNGRISLACWCELDKNPFLSVLINTLSKFRDIPAPAAKTPGIFAFADPQRIENVLSGAGFKNIKLEEVQIDVLEVADGKAYWEAISDLAAPIMALINELDESLRAAFIEELIQVADKLKQGETLCLSGTTWIASAAK